MDSPRSTSSRQDRRGSGPSYDSVGKVYLGWPRCDLSLKSSFYRKGLAIPRWYSVVNSARSLARNSSWIRPEASVGMDAVHVLRNRNHHSPCKPRSRSRELPVPRGSAVTLRPPFRRDSEGSQWSFRHSRAGPRISTPTEWADSCILASYLIPGSLGPDRV